MMGEMAEVNRITRTSSVQSQLSVDAEPVTPRPTRELETCNFYSNDLSQDAIAGVPPRNMRQLGKLLNKSRLKLFHQRMSKEGVYGDNSGLFLSHFSIKKYVVDTH